MKRLWIIVFGRIAGRGNAEFAANAFVDGALNLDHVVAYNKEVEAAGVANGRVSPMLIPMDTDERVRERQLTAHDVGNVGERSHPTWKTTRRSGGPAGLHFWSKCWSR